jgi:hypothetical protein
MKAAWFGVALLAAAATLDAQSPSTFKARLSTVPIDISMQATIAGKGSVTATLSGSKLAIAGTFEGLKSPATTAAIHRSPVRGVRGPEIAALTATAAVSGTISGAIDLTPQQVTDLRSGRLYVQLQSEKAPEGNLWGWLLEKR